MTSTAPKVSPAARYSVTEAAKLLGINPSTLYRYTEAGKIQALRRKANGRRCYKGEAILKLWHLTY